MPTSDSNVGPALSIAPLLRTVRRRGALVLAVTFVAAGAAVAWVLRAPKQYRAVATLLIERPLPTEMGIASPFGGLQEVSRFASTQWQILKSRTVLEAVTAKLELAQWPEFAGLDREQGLEALFAAVEVEPRGESALVDVGFVGLDPARASNLVNALCDAYLAHVVSREKEHVQRDLAAIDAELPRLGEQRELARKDLEHFKQENAFLTFDGREELLQEEMKQQSRIVQETREQFDALRARKSVIEKALETATSSGVDEARAGARASLAAALELEPRRETMQKLVEFEARRAELSGLQGTRKAQLEALDAEILRLRASIIEDEERAIDVVVLKCEIARQSVAHAEERIEELRATASELDKAKAHYTTLVTRAKDATDLYERLTQRRDELLVLEARSGAATRIFVQDRAAPPTQPCAPRPVAIVAVAVLLGLLLGSAGALLLERVDDRVGASEQLEASLETSSIAHIPHLAVHSGVSPEVEWMRRPQSFPADEFRKLFLTIGADLGTNGDARVISVLSAVPREGKTLVSIGLALAAARAGYRTLLVDGDLKRPRIHDVFSLDGEVGILDHLAGQVELAEVIHATSHESLSILPAGTPTADLERLAQPRQLARLVEQVRKLYQVVVIDTSPVLLSADAFVFARNADERLLVASASSSRIGPLRQALGQLRHLGIDVRGTVVNRFATPTAPYGAYGYGPDGPQRSRKSQPEPVLPAES